MPITLEAKLAIYQRNLRAYEASGDQERAEIQRRLIERLEKDGR